MPWSTRTEGQQVTFFNRADGTRLSFGPTPPRLRAPELLDVKLTDVCSVGCAFCYQDSRPDRGHAQLEDVAFIAAQAGEAGVFEVALGGGEVSEYPDFLAVLRLFRSAGVVPNFTTRRMRWLSRYWAEVRELVGGVAVSVGSAAEIRLLDGLLPASMRRSGQLVAQVVMGTVERPELLALMKGAGAAGIRVTLLGFKDVGRGQTFRPLPYDWWLDDLPQYVACTPVSIDTALAAECPAELEKLLLPGIYHTEEGRFSAYIDAVSMTLAPSSYHAGPVFPFGADWLAHFAAPDFVQGPPTPQAEGRVRLGFATNSSSSHSLVLLREPVQDEPKDPGEWEEAFATKYGTFTASSLEAKKYYLAANLMQTREHLFPGLSEEQAATEIRRLCELPLDAPLSVEGIDHQSAVWFYKNPTGPGPHPNQFARVKELLYTDSVSIFGMGEDGDFGSARWNAVEMGLDSADFVMMFQLSEALQPMTPVVLQQEQKLRLLGLDRGERFMRTAAAGLAAGMTWPEVVQALNLDIEGEKSNTREQQFSRLMDLAGLQPPDFLLREAGSYFGDEWWTWFSLYVEFGQPWLDRFMPLLKALRQKDVELSKLVLYYASSNTFTRDSLEAERLLSAMQDSDAFIKVVGTNASGIHVRLDEYIARF